MGNKIAREYRWLCVIIVLVRRGPANTKVITDSFVIHVNKYQRAITIKICCWNFLQPNKFIPMAPTVQGNCQSEPRWPPGGHLKGQH